MVPILRDANAPWRTHTYSEYNGWMRGGWKMRAVIGERYKYVYHHDDYDELFDLKKDPDETDEHHRRAAPAGACR
jgi:hypothetical protein